MIDIGKYLGGEGKVLAEIRISLPVLGKHLAVEREFPGVTGNLLLELRRFLLVIRTKSNIFTVKYGIII